VKLVLSHGLFRYWFGAAHVPAACLCSHFEHAPFNSAALPNAQSQPITRPRSPSGRCRASSLAIVWR
jgi:hypothetical protein